MTLCQLLPHVALVAVHSGVACRAERDQVLLGGGPRMAAELPVVHLEIRHRGARLTLPAYVGKQRQLSSRKIYGCIA